MKKFILLGALASLTVAVSCNEDRAIENPIKTQALSKNYDSEKNLIVITGLKSSVKKVVYSEKSDFLEDSYKKGFIPLKVSPEIGDEGLFHEVSQKLSSRTKMKIFENNKTIYSKTSDIYDDSETFLGDEDFASLLNDKGQIQVNDSIYMYTPNGLFMSHIDDYEDLEEFVKENPQIKVSEGYNLISSTIASYSPNQDFLNSFEIIDNPVSNLEMMPEDPGYGGGGGYTTPSIPVSTPSHYYNCNESNANTPFISNIFGNQYVCEYFFNSKKKVKNVFEVLDFYLFNSVRAKTKMREKGWTGIWNRENASKLYLKINTAAFQIERKTLTVSTGTDWKTITTAYKKIVKGNNDDPLSYISEEYEYNSSKKTYSKKVFFIKDKDFEYNMNTNSVYQPTIYESYQVSNIGDYRNMMNTSNKDIIVVVNILNLEGRPETKLEKLIKLSKPIWNKYIKDGKKPNQIAIVMNELGIYKNKENIVDVKPLYILTKDELVTVNNDHKVIYDFNIKKDFNLEGIEIAYILSPGGSESDKIKVKANLGYNKITKFSIDMEGGALYQGKWGGSTFSVIKE